MIGLKRGTVRLVNHRSPWYRFFKAEKRRLEKIFGDEAIDIQHAGSTAISGIPAKPIIDIVVGFRSLRNVGKFRKSLEKTGYHFRPKAGIPGRRIFYAKGPERRRTHHLNLVVINGLFWKQHVLFRDYLRKHKAIAQEYTELKTRLAQRYPKDRNQYTDGKDAFIRKILRKVKRPRRVR